MQISSNNGFFNPTPYVQQAYDILSQCKAQVQANQGASGASTSNSPLGNMEQQMLAEFQQNSMNNSGGSLDSQA